MMTQRLGTLFAALTLAGTAWMAGCKSDPECSGSADCERGTVCDKGSCEVIACEGAGGCGQVEGFVEACMFLGEGGTFDDGVAGVCTNQECAGPRDCGAGTTCVDGVCYASGAQCASDDDCDANESCESGACVAAEPDSCSTASDCGPGEFCDNGRCTDGSPDPCDTVECGSGETCVDGACVPSGCDPACGAGETCNEATGVCESASTGDGGLCDTCSADSDCGAPGARCVTLGATGRVCGAACTSESDCQEGFACFDFSGSTGRQCIPRSGSCTDCITAGCSGGQVCDTTSGDCVAPTPACGTCTTDAQCGAGSFCAPLGTGRVCLKGCAGTSCPTGYTCNETTLVGEQVCAPDSGSCSSCDLTAADCSGATPELDPVACRCVGCVTASDCGAGETCTQSGQCLRQRGTCSTSTDCGATGYCVEGYCVDCLTPSDCSGGQICTRGACAACECPADQVCDRSGACIDAPSGDCRNDNDCVNAATTLGDTGQYAACDTSTGSCYIAGVCNGTGGLGAPSRTDPFNAVCAGASVCTFDSLGMVYRCQSCFSSEDCRAAETCYTCGGTNVCVSPTEIGSNPLGALLCQPL
jgi:hypothetical protein